MGFIVHMYHCIGLLDRILILVVLLFVCFSFSVFRIHCNTTVTSQVYSKSTETVLVKQTVDFVNKLNSGEVEAALEVFAEGAYVISSDSEPVTGKEGSTLGVMLIGKLNHYIIPATNPHARSDRLTGYCTAYYISYTTQKS